MKLSIIIPIYGVEKYIKQCAISFLPFFNDPEKEIIFINDGTKDNSIDILKPVILHYSNVKIINRPNGGLSAARNTGIENAKGEYIYFADSDDYIDANNFEVLFTNGYAAKSDIIIGDFCKINEDTNLIESDKKYSLQKKEIIDQSWRFYLSNCKSISSVVWRCIYKKSLIDKYNLRFHEGVVYEDMEWTPIIFHKANLVYYSSTLFYYYRIRKNSIMTSEVSDKKVSDALEISRSLIEYGNQNVNKDAVSLFYRFALFIILNQIYKIDQETNPDLWSKAVAISQKMKKSYSIYGIIVRVMFAFPWIIVKKYRKTFGIK